jgi:hypothetical protein
MIRFAAPAWDHVVRRFPSKAEALILGVPVSRAGPFAR